MYTMWMKLTALDEVFPTILLLLLKDNIGRELHGLETYHEDFITDKLHYI